MQLSHRVRSHRGFTLVELIAVVVVLAILSAVAIPKYFDYGNKAKTASLQGSLGNIRAGIANFYADAAIAGTAAYPTSTQLTTVGTVMQQALPSNPYNNMSTIKVYTALADWTARSTDDTTGWCYYVDNTATPPVCGFWANSSTATTATGGSGGTTIQNANQL